MIGDGWNEEPAVRPVSGLEPRDGRRRVAVVTGSRAEFGLLRPVMRAVAAHKELELMVIAAGSHLIQPALTFRDVRAEFVVADSIPMQVAGRTGRAADAEAVGRGMGRFVRAFTAIAPDWVVVLGDRIEAFAAASAASIGGWTVAHIHGGDRAEGIADEAMRHAITKMAHLHLAATAASGERIVRMGERPEFVRVVGSPAVDDLRSIPAMSDADFAELGSPDTLVLMHPVGRSDEMEEAATGEVLTAAGGAGGGRKVLALYPNFDAGRAGVLRALMLSGVRLVEHLPRPKFVGLLKRLAGGGVMVGNSSSGLIEAAVLGVRVVDVGPRQNGRERAGNVIHAESENAESVRAAMTKAIALTPDANAHPYGMGVAGELSAAALASVDPRDPRLVRKRCAY
jgi:UDP-hydrolysing UDP-N-acetyl-D-glucosamine 2-epimerase